MTRLPQYALLAAALLAACSNVTAERPTGEVRGKVTLHGLDDSSGIVVSLAGQRAASARTNAKGEYLVSDLPPGQYTLTASADDVLERALETQVTVQQDQLVNAAPLELTPTGRIAGRVTLGGETGNAGITVVVPDSGASITTGDNGTFLLAHVPVGAHDVVAFYPGRQTANWKAVAVEHGKEAEVTAATLLAVAPAPGLVRGRAVLSGEASSAGVLVTATGPTSQATVTDASGHYRLEGLADGQYTISLVAPSTAEGSLTVAVTVAGGPVDAADQTFTPQGSVSGTVLVDGQEAQPGGVLVSVNGTTVTALSDVGGGFLLRAVPTGKRTLSFSFAGFDSQQLTGVPVAWAQSVTAKTVTLAKSRPLPGEIAGKVQLTGETSHAGVLVTVAGLVTQSQLTDASGGFLFQHLPDGAYSVSAQAASTVEGLKSQIVGVAGERALAPDFVFTPTGQLTGKVTLQGLSAPGLRGVRIQVSGSPQPVYTEADGTFTVRGVATGLHDVTASMAGFEAQTASAAVLYAQAVAVSDLALADVNECDQNNGGCDPNATCGNTPGSRTCSCTQGYAGNGLFCQDVNECLTNNGGCSQNARCDNTPGARTCTCKPGYAGTGISCQDVNECDTDNGGCSQNATCKNTDGARTCACKQGFSGDGVTCSDVNECLVNNGGCSLDADCTNGQGTRSCACKQGFAGDGVTCQDVNECLTSNGGCSQNATCTNTVGSRQCSCLAGFDGDGLSCKPRWMSVAAGTEHSFGIREDGTLWGWGTNASNTLGDGTSQPQLAPVRIGPAGTTWLQVATNGTSSCAVRSDASLWCWGDNASGQVGDGSLTPRPTPTRVGVDNNWSQAAVGTQNACAIRQNGTLWCWGDNASGQLGQGATGSPVRGPVQVGTDTWTKVSLQSTSVCAIKVDGTLWCWGNGQNLLQGGVAPSPQQLGATNDFVQLAHASGHLCVIRGLPTGGTLWCLGHNDSGQLGIGSQSPQTGFQPVGIATDWTAVDAGAAHTCARRANGTLWCWGSNADARLAQDPVSIPLLLAPRQVGTATDWKSVVNVGDRHGCAQKLDGSSWCWGLGALVGAAGGQTRAAPVETAWSN